jgi:site-specific recombinase XerD
MIGALIHLARSGCVAPVFTNTERLALAGFLAAYSGLTRQAYELDLRQFARWCQQHQLRLFQARSADIEFFARDLEARGRARATITRRLCTVAGFYRYAVEEELLDHSPAAHVRRPRLDYESHAVGLDRNELGALLAADGRRLDRHGAGRIVRRIVRRAGITKKVGPHTLRHAFITAALDAGVPLRDVQEAASHADPRTTMRYDRARTSLDRHATYIVAAYIARAAR